MNKKSGIKAALLLTIFAGAFYFEKKRPLRVATANKLNRTRINLAMAGVAALVVRPLVHATLLPAALNVEKRKWGLAHILPLSKLIRTVLVLLLLDYSLYGWHRTLHKSKFLWRFHNAHHTDLDLDVSTASRFHFGELFFASFFHLAQIIIVGATPTQFALYRFLVTSFAQFHHSNIRLPIGLEKFLNLWVVTPRMHGIHHSIVGDETNSNFGTILTIWDRLHKSIKLNIAQKDITIGVPAYRNIKEQTLAHTLALPFLPQRAWTLPTGQAPQRTPKGASSPFNLTA